MQYNNPFSIFTKDQIAQVERSGLKSLKKEILLQFQLTDETTIDLNGRSVDKNEVLQIFDTLQKDVDLHLLIYKIDPLFRFLNDGDLFFFRDGISQDRVLSNDLYAYQINEFIIAKLNKKTPALLQNPTFKTPNQIAEITKYVSRPDVNGADRAFANVFTQESHQIKGLRLNHESPFLDNFSTVFHPEVTKAVSIPYYKSLCALPQSFEQFCRDYAIWCHNDVVNEAFRRESYYDKFDRDDLQTISAAQTIGCDVSSSPAFKDNAEDLKKYLRHTATDIPNYQSRQKQKRQQTSTKRTQKRQPEYNDSFDGWVALRIIIICLKVMFLIAMCNRNSSSRYDYSPPRSGQSYNSPLELDLTPIKIDTFAAIPNFVGEKMDNNGVVHVKTTKTDSMYILNFTAKVIPAKRHGLAELIPLDIRKKENGKNIIFKMNFTNPDLPDFKFSHKLEVRVDEQRSSYLQKYFGHTHTSRSEKLITKRMLKKKTLKGKILRFDRSKNDELVQEIPFEIKAGKNPNERPLPESHPSTTEKYRSTFERWDDFYITNIADQQYKDIILNNLNQVSYKSIKKGYAFTLDKTYTYRPTSLSSKEPTIDSSKRMKSYLKYYLLSVDQVAYCSVNGKEFKMRFFVDKISGRTIGMSMGTYNPKDKVMEVIEVFFQ